MYEDRWYTCELEERSEQVMPDFSKIPEEKREMVIQGWKNRQGVASEEWQLWGPQIPMYQTLMNVRVLD
jgi:hypothetical protein